MAKDLNRVLPRSVAVQGCNVIIGGVDTDKTDTSPLNIVPKSIEREPLVPSHNGDEKRSHQTLADVLPKSYDSDGPVDVILGKNNCGIDTTGEDLNASIISSQSIVDEAQDPSQKGDKKEHQKKKTLADILPKSYYTDAPVDVILGKINGGIDTTKEDSNSSTIVSQSVADDSPSSSHKSDKRGQHQKNTLADILPKSYYADAPVDVILGKNNCGIDTTGEDSNASIISSQSIVDEAQDPSQKGDKKEHQKKKTLADILPKSYYADAPVDVILGKNNTFEQEDLPDITSSPAVVATPSAAHTGKSNSKNPYLRPVDAILPCYQYPEEDPYSEEDPYLINIPEDSKLKPLESITVCKTPRHTEPINLEDMSKQQLLEKIWGGDPNDVEEADDDCQLSPSFMATISSLRPRREGMLTEDDLHCILTDEYRFGVYGSSLYVRDHRGVYSEVTARTVKRLLMETLTKEQRKRFKVRLSNDVFERLLVDPDVRSNTLVFPQDKVLFANGAYNILTRLPAEIEDKDFYTTCINANYLPEEKRPCPTFKRYLESSSGGDETIKKRICAMLGYLMLLGYPGKVILVLGTAKNSGKSVIIRFFQKLVGPELVCGQSPFDMSVNHALSEFAGKVANAAMDIPAVVIKPHPIGTMKAVSGGDLVSMNPKGKDRQSVYCFTKQILGTNAPLHLQEFDAAFWERVVVIPYIHSISKEDRIVDLEDRLWEERDAIVTKCMKEAKRLLDADYEFPACPVADEMKDQWIGWRSYAKDYILKTCVAEEGCFTPSKPLYEAYLQHCTERALPYGTQTGFIRYAKFLFGIPLDEEARRMIAGVQYRGLLNVHCLVKLM